MAALPNSSGWRRVDYTRVRDMPARYGLDISAWKIIAVIRNPYERTASYYEHLRLTSSLSDTYRRRVRNKKIPFREFMYDPKMEWPSWYERTQRDLYPRPREDLEAYLRQEGVFRYWYSLNGELPRNFVVAKLENIDQELSEALEQKIHVSRVNVTAHRKSKEELFANDLCEIVEARCGWAMQWYDKWRPNGNCVLR